MTTWVRESPHQLPGGRAPHPEPAFDLVEEHNAPAAPAVRRREGILAVSLKAQYLVGHRTYHRCTHPHILMRVYMNAHMRAYIHMYVRKHMHTHVHAYVHSHLWYGGESYLLASRRAAPGRQVLLQAPG